MPWFKVDDKFHDHRKARLAGKSAVGVWALAGSWSADNLEDGFVPESVISRWGTVKDAEKLVEVGLWRRGEKKGEPGWFFHDWQERNPLRTEVEKEREANRERLREWRRKKRESERKRSA